MSKSMSMSKSKSKSNKFFWEEEDDLTVCRKGPLVGSIQRDEIADDPRKEFDHLCVMICWHKNYCLGDAYVRSMAKARGSYLWPEEYKSAEALVRSYGPGRVKPLYLYDHSKLRISLSPFSDPWDSGQVGWIYCSYEKFERECGAELSKRKMDSKILEIMRAEVEEYDQYLRCDVWTVGVEVSTEEIPAGSRELNLYLKLRQEEKLGQPRPHPDCPVCKLTFCKTEEPSSGSWTDLYGMLEGLTDPEHRVSGYFGFDNAKKEAETLLDYSLTEWEKRLTSEYRRLEL